MKYDIEGLKLPRSKFNLSHEYKLTSYMGQIKPFLRLDCIPGDYFKIGNQVVARTIPLVAPLMAEININTYYFFVPYRILFGEMVDDGRGEGKKLWQIHNNDFETFLTGGVTGNNNSVSLPYWLPTGGDVVNDDGSTVKDNGIGSLWDSFGLPIGVKPKLAYEDGTEHGAVNSFLKRAYNLIWNEYFRSENYQDYIDLDSNIVKNCCWGKDYFTTALPFPQRGTAPAINIDGTIPVTIDAGAFVPLIRQGGVYSGEGGQVGVMTSASGLGFDLRSDTYPTLFQKYDGTNAGFPSTGENHLVGVNLSGISGSGTASGHLTAVDTKDLRLMFQIQKIMERSMRSGYRYPEYLLSNFGVTIPDSTLQRPMFLGGSKNPLIVSEVLQTSESTDSSKQGHLAGHGLCVGVNNVTKFHVNEYGLLLGLMVIKPRASYSQGIHKTFMKQDKYDFMRPQFMHLSENHIMEAEIYAQDSASANAGIFGYQEMYNEYRHMMNVTTGEFLNNDGNNLYEGYHLSRYFASAPSMNSSFLVCNPRRDVFVSTETPSFLVNVGNKITAYRSLSKYGTPGFIDHM